MIDRQREKSGKREEKGYNQQDEEMSQERIQSVKIVELKLNPCELKCKNVKSSIACQLVSE